MVARVLFLSLPCRGNTIPPPRGLRVSRLLARLPSLGSCPLDAQSYRVRAWLAPAIHGPGVLDWRVAFRIGNAAREKHRAANGNFQELRLLRTCKTRLQLLVSLHQRYPIFRLQRTVERIIFQVLLQQPLAILK